MDFSRLNDWYRKDETPVVRSFMGSYPLTDKQRASVKDTARSIIENIRAQDQQGSIVAQLMQKYQLSSTQGVVLMCLAEALLRIPDTYTANKLLEDKIPQGEWDEVLTKNEGVLIKASNLALRASSVLLKQETESKVKEVISSVLSTSSEPFIRQAARYAMKLMANQFIVGRTIEEAQKNAAKEEENGYRYSYDMLGEAAVTFEDAERYFQSYKHAINTLARTGASQELFARASISVKLSALHPRYEALQADRVLEEITPKVLSLARKSKEAGITMTIDAEEADLLELSLRIFEKAFLDPDLKGWDGLGLAVQAYQKRAHLVIDELAALARKANKKIHVRLVKGAYWDTEIKRAQVNGLDGYPVFTRKPYTDISYIACADKLLSNRDIFFPKFATHNAYTVAAILELAGKDKSNFEFQRLHGMGEELYNNPEDDVKIPCRIYAPVGAHNDLLPYLVRRLLENGANTSFVHHLLDKSVDIEGLIEDPYEITKGFEEKSHPQIPSPIDLYQGERLNSFSYDLSDQKHKQIIQDALDTYQPLEGGLILDGKLKKDQKAEEVCSPYNTKQKVGTIHLATSDHVNTAFDIAQSAFEAWSTTPARDRAACLRKMADLMEANCAALMALCVKEAGKNIPDALAEVREAVDFCRYYATQAIKDFDEPRTLVGPTGELNQHSLHGRGVFVCISPWNFPLAIFVGQVAAALVAGNTVLAKPATTTTLIASEAVKLFHEAGIPAKALHLLPGSSREIGGPLIADVRVAGVALTGSVATGQAINRTLASKEGAIVPLIAETGGQNVMVVDSSALLEQVAQDVMTSSFQSAGQRCSALRVLFVQDDVADRLIEMLEGAMKTLKVGNPEDFDTDVPSVITAAAQKELNDHRTFMKKEAKLIYEIPLPDSCKNGMYVSPSAFEMENLDILTGEKFGPILHIVRYKAKDLEKVIESVNNMGFGLTLGIHSRIQSTIQTIHQKMHVGNTYVNRNMIGAVVGVQPFGGEGLSGTGPKAGGPLYLYRFASERTLCVDTTAQGGNSALMMLDL